MSLRVIIGQAVAVLLAWSLSPVAIAGNPSGEPEVARTVLQSALETKHDGSVVPWEDRRSGWSGEITVLRTRSENGVWCRDYRRLSRDRGGAAWKVSGHGCRKGNRWVVTERVESPTPATRAAAPATTAQIREIQQRLNDAGYNAGTPDGVMGQRTREAIRAYQRDNALVVDGKPSPALREHLAQTTPATRTPPDGEGRPGWTTGQVELRAEPAFAARKLARLQARTPITVGKRQGGWVQVQAPDSTVGWLRFSQVRLAAAGTAGKSPGSPGGSDGGAGANPFRMITGILGGGRSGTPQSQRTATVGIRGLNAEDLRAARPNQRDVNRMESFAADRGSAEQFARNAGLKSRSVALLPDPRAAAGGSDASSGSFNIEDE